MNTSISNGDQVFGITHGSVLVKFFNLLDVTISFFLLMK